MNTEYTIKAQTIILTVIIITSLISIITAWNSGYKNGKNDTIHRVERVLDSASNDLPRTFDAICHEFDGELD
jgi:hypothetical protein